MRQIFVDTSAWDAIADASDPNHEITRGLVLRDGRLPVFWLWVEWLWQDSLLALESVSLLNVQKRCG